MTDVPSHIPQFKVVLCGDGGTGKTTLVNKHKTGEFRRAYIPSVGATVIPLDWFTNFGRVVLKIWDTAGQEKLSMLRDAYYVGADAGLVMFDVTSRMTYHNVPNWHRDLVRIAEHIPIVICGNKVDVRDRKVKAKQITFHRKKNLQYYDISVRSGYNYEKPFVYLLKKLAKDDHLELVEQPAVEPHTAIIEDPEILQKRQAALERMAATPLDADIGGDDDDDF